VAVLTVNLPPVAVANASPKSGAPPLPVSFSSVGSFDPEGAALTYNWSFGDNSTSTAANPTHTYSSESNYVATLSVSDGLATVTSSNIAITVRVPPAITAQPPSQTVVATYPATFNVSAASTPRRVTSGLRTAPTCRPPQAPP